MKFYEWGLERVKYIHILLLFYRDKNTIFQKSLAQNYQTPKAKDFKLWMCQKFEKMKNGKSK